METITAKTPGQAPWAVCPCTLITLKAPCLRPWKPLPKSTPITLPLTSWASPPPYKKLVQEVETCAKALKTIGVREGDKVIIAMPNCPQAIYLFYAINLVGGIANMVHPLSAEKLGSISTNPKASPPSPSISSTINSSPSARTPRWSTSSLPASRMRWRSPSRPVTLAHTGRKDRKFPKTPRSSAGRNSCG